MWNERLNFCQLGHGYRRQWANDTISGKMSALGYHVARQKPTTNRLLTAHAIPVARQIVATNMHEAEAAAKAISYPVVVKPETGHKGIGVTVGVANITELARAVATAKSSGTKVIIEAFVPGRDVRMLVVNGRMVAAAMRSAPTVKGDGLATIEQLIKRENARRTQEIGRALPISIDAPLRSTLAKASLSLTDILPHGKVVALRSVANWSRGGIATDVTVDVHPDNADMAVRAAQAVGLDVAGVDFITPDISRPYYEVGGAICEVNYRPGLRVHLAANPDCRTQLGEALLCNMFSNDGRIPVIAVLSPAKQGVAAVVDNALRQSGRNSRVIDFNDEGVTFTNIVERYLADIDCEALVIAAPPEVVLAQGLGVDYCDLVIHSALPGKVEGAALEIVAARVHIVDDSSASSAGDIAAKVIDLLRHEPLPWRLPPLQLQPSRVKSIIGVAQKLGLSVNEMVRWSDAPIQRLGHGISQARYRSARTGQTSYIATTIADDKRRTNFVLQTHGLPVVLQQTVRSLSQARLAADRIGLPIVVKPAGSSESRGVSGMISTIDELSWAIKRASRHDDRFIIEPHLAGHDHRFLVVSGKAVHVTRHDPAHVIGDGKSMISELIDTENLNELRGPDKAQPYESLKLTDDALRTLEQQGLSPSSVPAAGAKIRLSSINSLSTGATAVDVTSVAHPLNIAAAERAARLIGLDICGVDFLLTDVARPYTEAGGAILEVNQRPAFDMHDAATNWNNVVRETVVRCMMAERSSSVPVLRMRTSNHAHTVKQVRQLTTGLSEAMGRTVGLVMPGGEGAAIRGSWLPQLNGDSAGVVRGLLADQRLEMVIFLDRDGAIFSRAARCRYIARSVRPVGCSAHAASGRHRVHTRRGCSNQRIEGL